MADPIVIVDAAGTEHEFPAGMDPKKAAEAVRRQNMANGLSATGMPVAGTDIQGGVRAGLEAEGNESARTAVAMYDAAKGYAKGLVPGAIHGVVETLKLPFTLAKMAIGDTADLLTEPVKTLTAARDSLKNAPAATVKAFNDAINLAATDPEAYGKAVGELTGTIEGGIATGAGVAALKKPLARGAGRVLVAAAEHPATARLTGGALLGHGVLKGDPLTAAAGIATMTAPSVASRVGRKLQEAGGAETNPELLARRQLSGAREVRANTSGPAIRVQPRPGGAPAPRVPYASPEPPPPEVPLTPREAGAASSGAREIDAGTIAGVGGEQPPVPPAGAVRVPYGAGEPGPYRASAKAAQKAEEAAAANAKKLAEIEETKKGRTPSEPTISESTSATDAEGRKVSSRRTFDTPEEATGTPAEPSPEDVMRGDLRKLGMTEGQIEKTMARQGRAGGAEAPAPAGTSSASTPPSETGEHLLEGGDLPGFEVVDETGGTAVNGSGESAASQEAINRAASERGRGVVRVKVDAGGNVQPIPSVGSQDVEPPPGGAIALQDAEGNLSPEKGTLPRAASTTPAEAPKPVIRVGAKGTLNALPPIKQVPPDLEALWTKHGAEEAGKLFAKANPGTFPKNLDPRTRTNLIREAMASKFDRYDAGGLLPEAAQGTIDEALAGMASASEKRAYLLKAPNATAFNYIWHRLTRAGA